MLDLGFRSIILTIIFVPFYEKHIYFAFSPRDPLGAGFPWCFVFSENQRSIAHIQVEMHHCHLPSCQEDGSYQCSIKVVL